MTNQTRSLGAETHDRPDNNESSSSRVELNKCRDTAQEPDLVLNSADVSDPALYQQDIWQPLFARLRSEAPVHYCSESRYGPYWSVTRYRDIMTVEPDHTTYSSEQRGFQIEDVPADMPRRSFIRMDPPQHTIQRRTVAPVAAPTSVAGWEATARQRTAAVLDNLPRNETFDWVDRVSVELTTMMLATLFDFPWEERRKLRYWSNVAICDVTAPDAPVHSEEERFAELRRMAEVFRELWKQRIDAPPKLDLISMMAHSPDTRDMPEPEFIGNLMLLIVGGNDTTRNAMSGGVLALSENPAELRKLKANPALVPSLAAETIRYQTPIIHMRRTATCDAELAGKWIRRGDKVVMWYVSGNRDESVIDRPDAFIVDRAKPRQRVCITAACLRVAKCFELAGSRAVYESSSLQRRVRDLRVAAQHVAVHPRHYIAAGDAVLARMS
jgi:cytochrome P450